MRYKITIEYDGTDFSGWQKHKHIEDEDYQSKGNELCVKHKTIQESIEEAIFKFSQIKAELCASGRTDRGVHAIAQVAHFDLELNLPPDKITNAINFYLKGEKISIIKTELVPDNFHARFDAIERRYKYRIINRIPPVILEKTRVWQIYKKIDLTKLIESSNQLIGKHNFNSFRSTICQAKNVTRTIENIIVDAYGDLIEITFIAKSFLHNQVRIMVGTLIEIAIGKKELSIQSILLKQQRIYAGVTAPSCGLYLVEIKY